MFSKKTPELKGSKAMTIVGEGVVIEGKFYSPGSTRIDGMVYGDIISEKEFIVGKEGKVEASVKTKNAVIAGTLKGEMIASGEVEITSTGKFVGTLTQKDALLTISKGRILLLLNKIPASNKILKM